MIHNIQDLFAHFKVSNFPDLAVAMLALTSHTQKFRLTATSPGIRKGDRVAHGIRYDGNQYELWKQVTTTCGGIRSSWVENGHSRVRRYGLPSYVQAFLDETAPDIPTPDLWEDPRIRVIKETLVGDTHTRTVTFWIAAPEETPHNGYLTLTQGFTVAVPPQNIPFPFMLSDLVDTVRDFGQAADSLQVQLENGLSM